jgi:hypothetical protein
MRTRTGMAIALAIGLVVMTATGAWAADTWTLMGSKNPGAEWDWFHGVTAVSSTNAWAVGQYVQAEGGAVVGLIEHSDGSSWTVAFTKVGTDLEGVKATSASNIWAVGYDSSGPAILHYDGTSWSTQSSPSVSNGYLYAVAASSKSDAWAVGRRQGNPHTTMLIEHWNGTTWKLFKLRNPGSAVNELYGVTSTSPTNVWAVGIYGNSLNATKALVLHYDGTHWFRWAARNPGSCGGYLQSVSATSPTDVWASGLYCSSGQRGLVEHYNGTGWAAFGFTTASDLPGIKAVSSSNVWTVGQAVDDSSYAAHWDGLSWTRQSTPGSPSGSDELIAVAAGSSSTAFAVGQSIYNAFKIRTLAMVCCS